MVFDRPRGRTAEIHAGGQVISWWSGQGFHPLAGECLLQAVGVALGGDQVGVVQEPVHGRGGEGLGMKVSKPDGWMLLVTAIERLS